MRPSVSLTALTFAALAAGNPVNVERDAPTNCYFIMTPTPELSSEEQKTSLNYAVTFTVAAHWEAHNVRADNAPLVRHDDGTYDVQSAISVDGVSEEEVAVFVSTWDHTTLQGFGSEWYVDALNCVV